ncbi:2-oxo-4-hydroxy-4-carboxy-5-ureidoimidazoline decarboxylase [Neokomagataea anthophila]|uniref:2-oxo-4-hydroxy-4-carboxy-5-ureidoimidazoline decarboxylase n=1 Tax=Neokomagataea anthophila TaxID=2826925 RepID=A0ABS5E956_9PROT|nr:2-oxo-4-hydroxy-4-carboxy-5-ureidoimidazoline decarboxylase [Neokomagataea anthophila]MBR0560437.1 2-oxo-4-hydroxy-4-carboxy-5-ureidoimidazoline decarboxylase [Neokomagataea anthophila]
MLKQTLDAINQLSHSAFVECFGRVYEHSPWVADQACMHRPFSSFEAMKKVFSDVVKNAGFHEQMGLVRAHPELGHRAGIDPELSPESTSEQGQVGLDRLTPQEYAQFKCLNEAYADKFQMPFIICVRQANKKIILDAMAKRLMSTPEAELITALEQIDRIADLRLQDKVIL